MKKRRLVVIATTLAVACGATACSGDGGPTDSQSDYDPQIATAAPAGDEQVDSITWNIPSGEPLSLDPAQAWIDSNSTVEANLCEPLMRFKSDYTQEPALATSVGHPNSTTWVFHLREGVTFWDGTPMTAADVVYSLKRVLDPKVGSSWSRWPPDGATITADGTHTVTLKVPKFNSAISNYFATPAFAVVSKAFAEKAGKTFGSPAGGVMCTGPYELDPSDWVSGQSITVKRNDHWWDHGDLPKVRSVKFEFVTDPAAQTAGVANGEIDGQWKPGISSFTQLEKADGHLLHAHGLATSYLSVLSFDGALGDVKVRRALQKSIDYDGIVKSVYRGAATPLRAIAPPTGWGYGKKVFQAGWNALPEPAQDLDAARKLASSSSKASEPINLAYRTTSDEATKIVTAIAASANSIGLNVKLKPLTGDEYGALFYDSGARKGLDMFLITGALDFPDPAPYYQFFTIGDPNNFNGYANKEYTAQITSAMGAADPDKKAEHVVAAQKIMAADLVDIPLVTQTTSVYYSGSLGGLLPSGSFIYTPWAADLGGRKDRR